MDIFQIILRIVHVFAAVYWVGAATFFQLVIQPALQSAGSAGQQAQSKIATSPAFAASMAAAAVLTTLAGIILYLRWTNGLDMNVIGTGPGIVFGIGGLAGIAAFVVSAFVISPISAQLSRLSQQAAGGPPAPETLAQIQGLAARVQQMSRIALALMLIALFGMAIARYVTF